MRVSPPLRLLLSLIGNAALVWFIAVRFTPYATVEGGLGAYVIIGSLLTLLNLFLRPVLRLLTLPLKLLSTLVASMAANVGFLWVVERAAVKLDPALVTFHVTDTWFGWLIVAAVLGLGNWLVKESLQ